MAQCIKKDVNTVYLGRVTICSTHTKPISLNKFHLTLSSRPHVGLISLLCKPLIEHFQRILFDFHSFTFYLTNKNLQTMKLWKWEERKNEPQSFIPVYFLQTFNRIFSGCLIFPFLEIHTATHPHSWIICEHSTTGIYFYRFMRLITSSWTHT